MGEPDVLAWKYGDAARSAAADVWPVLDDRSRSDAERNEAMNYLRNRDDIVASALSGNAHRGWADLSARIVAERRWTEFRPQLERLAKSDDVRLSEQARLAAAALQSSDG